MVTSKIQRALKKEAGVRLSAAEVQRLANLLGLGFPESKRRGKSAYVHKTPPKGEPLDVHPRWMIRRDMGEVLRIDGESFEEPWSEADFLQALRERNTIGMVAERGEAIVGSMIYELHKGRLVVLRMSVCPKQRCRGVGRQLLGRLIGKLTASGRTEIRMEVPETNMDALMFLQNQGFRATGIFSRFHAPDLIQMTYCLSDLEQVFERGVVSELPEEKSEWVDSGDDDDDDDLTGCG